MYIHDKRQFIIEYHKIATVKYM